MKSFFPKLSPKQWLTRVVSPLVVVTLLFIFPEFWDVILWLLLIITIHELGHFFAARYCKYNAQLHYILPFGAYVDIREPIIFQRSMIWILLAGPLPGMAIGGVLFYVSSVSSFHYLEWVGAGFILINAINLLPVFPLDGYKIWSYLFDFDKLRTLVFASISVGITVFFMVYAREYLLIPLIIFQLLFVAATLYNYRNIHYPQGLSMAEFKAWKSTAEASSMNNQPEEHILIKNIKNMEAAFYSILFTALMVFSVIFIVQYV